MPKPYEVLERSFINGRLYEPGERLTLEIDSPGGNLKLLAAAASTTNAQAPQSGFASARTGGGKFLVKDAVGNVIGSFIGSKAEADAEADRLNAGGEPTNAQAPQQLGSDTDTDTDTGTGTGEGSTGTADGGGGAGGSGLPDA